MLVTIASPGQISAHTFDFLKNLAKPECNDREWLAPLPYIYVNLYPRVKYRFRLHGAFPSLSTMVPTYLLTDYSPDPEPIYRMAEKVPPSNFKNKSILNLLARNGNPSSTHSLPSSWK